MYHLCSTYPHTSSTTAGAQPKRQARSSILAQILTSIDTPAGLVSNNSGKQMRLVQTRVKPDWAVQTFR